MPHGYFIESGPGILREADTATCGHCQFIMYLPPPKDAKIIVGVSGGCPRCRKMICNECQKLGRCDPWEEQMKRMEAKDASRRSMGLV